MIRIRRAKERGHFDFGWLNTYHTFSFDQYYDPNHMAFRALRVINEDRVAPGAGFPTHSHRDMEIITYILEGALRHQDSMGNGSVIRPGDVQRMTAGTGVAHSEFNPSQNEPVHLLQIWILPNQKGLTPGYEQKAFSEEERRNELRLIASPTGESGAVKINQDARVFASIVDDKQQVEYSLQSERHAWIQVARGTVSVNNQTLEQGDGAAISEEISLTIAGDGTAEVLLFDLA